VTERICKQGGSGGAVGSHNILKDNECKMRHEFNNFRAMIRYRYSLLLRIPHFPL
jgi:hypothetical protein